MSNRFAIGDIHGCSKTFKKLLEILSIKKSDKIYCIGDYIDYGYDSKGVLDIIINLRQKGYQIHTIRGNHEQLMIDSLKSKLHFDHWIENGGEATLNSFNVASVHDIPNVYKTFLSRTKHYIKSDDLIFVHAGLNCQIENPFKDKGAMMWIRNFDKNSTLFKSHKIIHGHTPKHIELIQQQRTNILNIDGGCVFKSTEGLGNLIAFNIKKMEWIIVPNIE